ncbi:MAG: quinolinate synthase NadA [Oligoflexia bacterium]|nr:quinolinate synthase NadA [Oligoflexia bacterium]
MDYEHLSENELIEKIIAAKQRYGEDLIILGHHYQRGQIVKLSDFVGDSFGLSEKAATSKAKNIVFCGVRFMAESAAILAKKNQKVYHPDPDAGCPMADMANMEQVQLAWNKITKATNQKIIPVTYMNSTAELKAFCGLMDGIVCTSSNAEKVFQWAYERGSKIFFFPDEHLGRNTGKKFKIHQDQMLLWDPHGEKMAEDKEIKSAKLILWRGHCPVHMEFKLRDVKHVRKQFPGCKVVVHPECEQEVVDASDANGSTDFIVKYVSALEPGSIVFVGTEVNLVTRLQKLNPDKKVFKLQRSLCLTMYQINLSNLAHTLDNLDKLETVNLTQETIENAKTALDRMLNLNKTSLPNSRTELTSD